ncbi:MAG: DUF4383 domain-containing protein [Patescibacteria group bacterium]
MAKKLAVIFGIVFVLVGVLGLFVPNPIVGREAMDASMKSPIFVTDAIHDLVHLLVGVVLLLASGKGNKASATALKVFGVVYLILFVNGLINPDLLLGFVKQNAADTYLHLALGIVLLIAGMASRGSNPMVMDKSTM